MITRLGAVDVTRAARQRTIDDACVVFVELFEAFLGQLFVFEMEGFVFFCRKGRESELIKVGRTAVNRPKRRST